MLARRGSWWPKLVLLQARSCFSSMAAAAAAPKRLRVSDFSTSSSNSCAVRRIGTHNGSFHCDEALGCFMIRLTNKFAGSEIVRTRDAEEELRKSIIDQVKRSDILNKDGSEDMKPRQLSDAIYEELGRKITGQISDEIWKTIRLNESIKDDIKGTVEHVINKMVNPMPQTSLGSNPSPTQENQILGREANGIIKTSIVTPTSEANISNSNKTYEPPGFGSGDADNGESKNSDLQENEQRAGLIQNPQELLKPIEDVECGFSSSGGGAGSGEVDDDTDLPPGFN